MLPPTDPFVNPCRVASFMVGWRTMKTIQKYSEIPAVERVLARLPGTLLASPPSRRAAVAEVRAVLAERRAALKNGVAPRVAECTPEAVGREVEARLARGGAGTLRPVVNATGIVLHTNLGRAPLSPAWLDEARDRVAGYCSLEYDLSGRRRGSRDDHLTTLLRQLVPTAEAALVVNNGAAAVMLALAALARGRDVVVSRGELVEIGGGFRIPDVMALSGARLVEVGTTNRTRAGDYDMAVTPDTALLFRAHRSNFRMVGFTEQVSDRDLAALAHRHGLLALCDLGSGKVTDPGIPATADEPGPADVLAAGMDLVCVSGDKLLGGPQAGILLGRAPVIESLRRHPLYRALRVDKLALGVLEACLRRHAAGDLDGIPALQALRLPPEEVRRRALSLSRRAARLCGGALSLRVVASEAQAGGGTLPARAIPSYALEVRREGWSEAATEAFLRAGDPPVLGRLVEGALRLDPRTLLPGQDAVVVRALAALAGAPPPGATAAKAAAPASDNDDCI
jgi:L-seryl-tRNA(Ser) seleniumtransferase